MGRGAVRLTMLSVLLIGVIALPQVSTGASEPARQAAIGGTITLRLSYDSDGLGVFARGSVRSRRVCAYFRRVRFKFLNPPSGSPRLLREDAYNVLGHYDASWAPPSRPGIYYYRAIAFKQRRAVGLKRGKCATIRSPVRSITVLPVGP